jgi:hypothetical protein
MAATELGKLAVLRGVFSKRTTNCFDWAATPKDSNGLYNLRQQLAPVQGVTFPAPDGGKYQQIMVGLDPLKLQARRLTPIDVVTNRRVVEVLRASSTALRFAASPPMR